MSFDTTIPEFKDVDIVDLPEEGQGTRTLFRL